jgi:hypothetical protein
MDYQIELTHKFLDLSEVHPAVANAFYKENQDAIDWVLDTWKKYYNELKNIKDKDLFHRALKEKMNDRSKN